MAKRQNTFTGRWHITEMEMWDQRGLVRAWLEANMRRADEAHFARVDVYRYVK